MVKRMYMIRVEVGDTPPSECGACPWLKHEFDWSARCGVLKQKIANGEPGRLPTGPRLQECIDSEWAYLEYGGEKTSVES